MNVCGFSSDDEMGEILSGTESRKVKVSEKDGANLDDPNAHRQLKARYYKVGAFHGKPSGCFMFDLCHSLGKNTNEKLWLACVCRANQFVHGKLTNERYQTGLLEVEQHVNSSGNLEGVAFVALRDGTKIWAPDYFRIVCEDEPRVLLLREWNLFDSMVSSSYVATKLRTWSENGL